MLVHDGQVITERGAIILHLTSLFPDSGLAPKVGTPEWGAFAGWLTWYHAVMEPVLVFDYAKIDHPILGITFRGPDEVAARIRRALERGPWLLGETYSAADLLVHAPYAWFKDATPNDPLILDWVERCKHVLHDSAPCPQMRRIRRRFRSGIGRMQTPASGLQAFACRDICTARMPAITMATPSMSSG